MNQARWVDRPCHRSALAGPALAAILIEEFDPHSAVTFISFACSGAVIEQLLTSPQQKGSRLNQPQLNKVFEAAGQRTIDALLISIGGNDVHFADLVLKAIKLRHADTDGAANQLARDGLASLPTKFAALAQRIGDPSHAARVTNVFITQYPDLVRDETKDFCDHSTPVTELLFSINGAESEWALNKVIVPLNEAIQSAATNFGWIYVDGILRKFGGDSSDGLAHGFCADDQRWVNTFNDSWRIQGDKNGTVHPNLDGYSWYAQRLFQAVRAKILLTQPSP